MTVILSYFLTFPCMLHTPPYDYFYFIFFILADEDHSPVVNQRYVVAM